MKGREEKTRVSRNLYYKNQLQFDRQSAGSDLRTPSSIFHLKKIFTHSKVSGKQNYQTCYDKDVYWL